MTFRQDENRLFGFRILLMKNFYFMILSLQWECKLQKVNKGVFSLSKACLRKACAEGIKFLHSL